MGERVLRIRIVVVPIKGLQALVSGRLVYDRVISPNDPPVFR